MRRPRIVRQSLVGLVAIAFAAASVATAAPSQSGSAVPHKLPTADGGVPPILWSGQAWLPTSACPGNDHCFRQTPDTVFVDTAGRLHLRIIEANGKWWGSEIASVNEDYGYGTYRWVLDTPTGPLDPASVIGLFTYNGVRDTSQPKNDHVGHLEADFEITRWRSPQNKQNLQETIQPYWNPANFRRFALPGNQSPLTLEFTWAPTGTTFVVRRGAGATAPVYKRWSTPAPIGTPRLGTKVLLDFWSYHGPLLSWTPQEVVVDSFSYTPAGLPPVLPISR